MHAHIIMSTTRFSNILTPLIYTPFILFLTIESLYWGLIVMSVVAFKDISLKYLSLTCQWSHECGMNGKIALLFLPEDFVGCLCHLICI